MAGRVSAKDHNSALDCAIRGESTFALFRELDALVGSAGGAVYPAKDARMAPGLFRSGYPRIEEFLRQNKGDHTDLDGCYQMLAEVLKPQPVPVADPTPARPGAAQGQQRPAAMPTLRSAGLKPQTIAAR